MGKAEQSRIWRQHELKGSQIEPRQERGLAHLDSPSFVMALHVNSQIDETPSVIISQCSHVIFSIWTFPKISAFTVALCCSPNGTIHTGDLVCRLFWAWNAAQQSHCRTSFPVNPCVYNSLFQPPWYTVREESRAWS